MNSLNIDFRDGCLRIIATKDGSVKYSRLVKDFSLVDLKSAKEKLVSEIKEAGGKKGKVNIILPSDIVRHKTFQIPAMEFEDVKMVIRREISKELKGEKFAFGIRRLLTPKAKSGGQDILTEYVLTADVLKYLDLFKGCRIKPDIVTTSLEGNIHQFNRLRPETDGNEAVLDIGTNLIEIAVFNNGRLLEYEKLLMPHDEKFERKDLPAEQMDKMKIYRIIDTLYNFIMASGKNSPEEKLSMLWICGIGSIAEGITDSISDGLGVGSRLINPFDTAVENGSAFTALKGVSLISRTEQFINLIPEDILAERTKLLRRTLLAASLSFYVLLIAGGYLILEEPIKSLKDIYKKEDALLHARTGKKDVSDYYSEGYKTMANLYSDNQSLYSVFRDIANLTPDEVVLKGLQLEKKQGCYQVNIEASVPYSDEVTKKAILSRFISKLDNSTHLKRISYPHITVAKEQEKPKEFVIKLSYEVVQ